MDLVYSAGKANIMPFRQIGLGFGLALAAALWAGSVSAQTPSAPTNLVVTSIFADQVCLTWSDTSTNEDGFKVERSMDGTNFAQVSQTLANTISLRNSGLWPGVAYWYRVRAFKGGNNSGFSNTGSSTTPDACESAVVTWGGGPTVPPGLTNVVAVSAGSGHSLVLLRDGTVVGWGQDDYGQADVPAGLSNAVAVSAGWLHSLALKADGTVVAWGANFSGQATVPAGLTNVVAIAAGEYQSLVLKSDGTTVGFGDPSPRPPSGLTGIVAIAADYHSLVLRSDGTVLGYGVNTYGELNPPAGLSNAVAVAAGIHHSVALEADGTVVAWGGNYVGQATPPGWLNSVVSISAGWFNSLALRSDGTVVVWGDDEWGQTNVPPGMTGVRVANISGVGDHSLAMTCAPAAPTGLMVVLVSTNQFDLAWTDNSDNEIGFTVERALDVGGYPGVWAAIAVLSSNTTGYSDVGLPVDTKFWYRVRASGAGGESAPSNELGVPTPTLPPSGLSATEAYTNQIILTWTDNSQTEDGFKIERAPDNAGSPGAWSQIAVVATNVTTFSDTGLPLNTVFWYRVRAFNVSGDTAVSAPVSEFIPSAPLAPAILAATPVSYSQMSVSWTNNVVDADGFKVERAPDGGGVPGSWTQIAVVSNATVYVDTGLTGDTVFWYRVRAFNGGGDSTYSDPVSATTALRPPTLSVATASSTNQVNLTWTDNSSTEDGFKIERALDAGGSPGTWGQIATVNSNVTTYSDASLMDGTKYWYRVRAYNVRGDSDYSNQANAITQLVPPSGLAASPVPANRITLSWTDNSQREDGYRIERTGLGELKYVQIGVTISNVTTYADGTVVCGQRYLYRVRGFNTLINSAYSNVSTGNTSSVDSDGDGTTDCWMLQNFGHATGQAADRTRADDDADGDGLSNLQEFLAGTSPTNAASALRIIAATPTNNYGLLITWTTAAGHTNVVQAAPAPDGVYSNICANIIIPIGNGGTLTTGRTNTYTDAGALTNSTMRFYRVRLVP